VSSFFPDRSAEKTDQSKEPSGHPWVPVGPKQTWLKEIIEHALLSSQRATAHLVPVGAVFHPGVGRTTRTVPSEAAFPLCCAPTLSGISRGGQIGVLGNDDPEFFVGNPISPAMVRPFRRERRTTWNHQRQHDEACTDRGAGVADPSASGVRCVREVGSGPGRPPEGCSVLGVRRVLHSTGPKPMLRPVSRRTRPPRSRPGGPFAATGRTLPQGQGRSNRS
jgi:hypothetical protein